MWELIKDFFGEQINSNMLLQGGLALSVLGGVAMTLKIWGLALWKLLLKKILFSVTISKDSTQELHAALLAYFRDEMKSMSRVIFKQNYAGLTIKVPIGSFLLWKKRNLILVSFSQQKVEGAQYASAMFDYIIEIKGLFARADINSIIETAMNEYNKSLAKNDGTIRVNRMTSEGVKFIGTHKPKSIDDVVMEARSKKELLNVLNKWNSSEEEYITLGLPYKLGLMLYGTPGTGKTSLAYAIARHLNFQVVRCNMFDIHSEMDFNSSEFVYVFDDIDREVNEIRSIDQDDKGKSKSKNIKPLLGLLDARFAMNKSIVVMSCNDIDSIDSAIFRPGRVDMVLEFCPPTKEMAEEFMGKFFKKTVVLPDFKPGRSMSFYQTCCLRHMNNVGSAVREACDELSNINYSPKGNANRAVHELKEKVKKMEVT